MIEIALKLSTLLPFYLFFIFFSLLVGRVKFIVGWACNPFEKKRKKKSISDVEEQDLCTVYEEN